MLSFGPLGCKYASTAATTASTAARKTITEYSAQFWCELGDVVATARSQIANDRVNPKKKQ